MVEVITFPLLGHERFGGVRQTWLNLPLPLPGYVTLAQLPNLSEPPLLSL